MRFKIRTVLVAALGAAAVAVAIAQASPPPTADTAAAGNVKVLKGINKQLKRLNRSLGTSESKGVRGQLQALNANVGPSPTAGLRGQVQELRGEVRTLNQVRDLLRALQGMPRSLDRIANNTAFEEVP